jgi:23S rRNA-/tRNA-specific pseudouridylate synthase
VRAGETILLQRPAPSTRGAATLRGAVEDASVMVIDKPAGLPCTPPRSSGATRWSRCCRELYPDEQMEIAHRIDRETSGVLLIARDRAVASFLTRAFARRAVEKTYLRWSRAIPRRGAHRDAAAAAGHEVTRDDGAGARREPGLAAQTQFRVLRRLPGHALVRARPLTGRQHQIPRPLRVDRGHPMRGRQALRRRARRCFMRAVARSR